MARSQAPVITVKIPIDWGKMTGRKRKRLRQILGRDSRVIHAFFGIIEQNEQALLRGKNKDRIDENKLHAMTMTALKVDKGEPQRLLVEHDLKDRFSRMSANELSECRMIAVANYESYLALRKRRRNLSRPSKVRGSGRIPRRMFIPYRARLFEKRGAFSSWWIDIRDSLDSVPEGRRVHDRLVLPLKTAPFHLQQLQRGHSKSVQVTVDKNGKWWAAVAVRLSLDNQSEDTSLPPAVLGIDLGINRAACTTLITKDKVSETRYFVQREKVALMEKYDRQLAALQRELDTRRDAGVRHDHVARKLKQLSSKRENISREYDRCFVSQLLDYISILNEKYMLFVAIGRLKGIRRTARKGNYKGRLFRGRIHRWTFARVTRTLRHGLEQLGWKTEGKNSRFHVVSESWTSITCWKCGCKGIRPKQSLFVCHTCGFRTNADRNGSLNIARRLIKLIPSLRDEKGLGRWATPERAPAPKAARRFRSSKQKSPLSHKG